MITVEMIRALQNNDGMTLKNGKAIIYKTGWQVATEGVEVATAEECFRAVQKYNGTCGIWYSDGVYYVDKSMRVKTKKQAMEIGRMHNQISILKWKDLSLVYC